VLVTGYDIIFFWVARMIFSGIEHTGQTPFHTVFIHGIVRMSKAGRCRSRSETASIRSKYIDSFGADALRYALVTVNAPGNDQRFSTEKIEAPQFHQQDLERLPFHGDESRRRNGLFLREP
jgi:valyl-tRNA synthetase